MVMAREGGLGQHRGIGRGRVVQLVMQTEALPIPKWASRLHLHTAADHDWPPIIYRQDYGLSLGGRLWQQVTNCNCAACCPGIMRPARLHEMASIAPLRLFR